MKITMLRSREDRQGPKTPRTVVGVRRIRILAVPDCVNVALARQRVEQAAAGSGGVVQVEVQVIETVQEAAVAGMCGSPTLLVEGVDPFAVPGQSPSVSCRLYRDGPGNLSGAPSVEQIRTVLELPLG